MPGPTAFEQVIHVAASDIDALGHVNNVVYVQWVQDVAVAHWQSLASPEAQAELVWMVLRHEIDYKRPARLGEEVILHLGGDVGRTTLRAAHRGPSGQRSSTARTGTDALVSH